MNLVAFRFDDGYSSVYDTVMPILRENGFKASVYVIVGAIGTNGFLLWRQLLELQNKYGWEIGSHTYTHVSPVKMDFGTDRYEVIESKRTLQQHGLNIQGFAVPYNHNHKLIMHLIRPSYSYCTTGKNGDFDIYNLKSIYVTMTTTIKQLFDDLTQPMNIITFHDIIKTPSKFWDWDINNFENLVNHLHDGGYTVTTVRDLLERNILLQTSAGPHRTDNTN